MDSRTFTAGNFLGGDQLTEKQREGFKLTIATVDVQEMRNGTEKLCLHFLEEGFKPFLVNKTNAKRLQTMYGHDTDAWHGESITLWFDEDVEYMGDIVGGIRVRVEKAKKK